MESLAGTAWILLQDIGAFTALTERMERAGPEGVERLGRTIRSFFRRAEEILQRHGGQVISLVGDAYWGLLPAEVSKDIVHTLARELLDLPVFWKEGLSSRVIAVRGPVRLATCPSGSGINRVLEGLGVDLARELEETTEAGHVVVQEMLSTSPLVLPEPPPFSLPSYPLRLLPLVVAFVEIPEREDLAQVLAFFQEHDLWLAKWIPSARNRLALVVGGFPYATGEEAHRMIRTLAKARQEGFVLRAGVSQGLVFTGRIRGRTFEEILLIGDTVNVASRVLGLAGEGEILLGNTEVENESVRWLGAVRVRGRDRPVRLGFLERTVPLRPPLRLPFMGRDREVRWLQEHLARGGRVVVKGPAGVGKTRLVEEALKGMDLTAVWIRGYTGLAPLSGLRALTRSLPSPPSVIRAYLEGKTPVPREEVVEAVRVWLESYASFVLVLDHVDGLDEASRRMFETIFSRLSHEIPVVLTLRNPPFPVSSPEVMSLEPLAEAFQRSIIRAVAPELPPDREEALIRQCGGNLFCLELALAARKAGHTDLPTTPFLSAVQHLSSGALRVVEYLACAGIPLREEELPEWTDRVREELVYSGLVQITAEGITLQGEPLERAVLSSIPPSRRRRRYRMLADRAASQGVRGSEELARWYTLGRAPGRAASFWQDVVDERYFQALYEELDRVERFLEGQGGRFRSLVRLVHARRAMREGRYHEAERVFHDVALRRTFRKIALINLVELYDWWERYDSMKQCLVALFLHRHTMTPREQVSYRGALGIWHDMQGDHAKALDWYERCLAFARKYGLQDAEATALFNIGWIHQKEKRWEEARAFYLVSLEKARTRYAQAAAILRLGDLHVFQDRLEEARHLYEQALKLFQEIRFPFWENITLRNLSLTEAFLGLGEEAMAHARKVQKREGEHWPFLVALVLGDRKTVQEHLEEVGERFRILGEVLLGRRSPESIDPDQYGFFIRKVVDRVMAHAAQGKGSP